MLESYTPLAVKEQYFDTHEMLRHIANTPRRWMGEHSRSNAPSSGWDMNTGYDGALRLLNDGWEEGVQCITALAGTVPNGGRTTERHDFAGERPDVGRYLAGDPRNMIRRGNERKPKPTMSIVVSIGANCNVTSSQMWNYGAALVALVDRLESRGVRVEVWSLWATTGLNRTSLSVRVKQTQDAMDISALAFCLAHPAMLRRVMFAVIERTRQKDLIGYGVSQTLISEDDMVAPPQGALFIGGVGSSGAACHSLQAALDYAKGQINRAAGSAIVELEEAA